MMRRISFVALIIALLVVMYRNRRDLNYDVHYVLNTLDEMIESVVNAYVKTKYCCLRDALTSLIAYRLRSEPDGLYSRDAGEVSEQAN